MAKATSKPAVTQLILVPSIITLAITGLRLVGELQHWPKTFFNPAAGGGGSIIGITWLVPILGVYFGLKLCRAEAAPSSPRRAIGCSLLGLIVGFAGIFVIVAPQINLPGKPVVGMVLLVLGIITPFFGWAALSKVLLSYGYAARIPVVVLMYFAIRGNWGTHYDVAPPNFPTDVSFWSKYMQIAFVPQMFMWIAFTVSVGGLFGGITAAVHKGKSSRESATQAA